MVYCYGFSRNTVKDALRSAVAPKAYCCENGEKLKQNRKNGRVISIVL
jgi:hypothetical protein